MNYETHIGPYIQGPQGMGAAPGEGDACSANRCLPSGDAAVALMRGNMDALPLVITTTVLRGALVAGGLAVAGARGKELVKYTAGATLAIEVFVLGWAWWQARKDRDANVPAPTP